MDRRSFLASLAPDDVKQTTRASGVKASSGKLMRSAAGLEAYTGPWDIRHAEHLLRRTTFGYTKAQLEQFAALSFDQAITALFAAGPAPPEPYAYAPSDLNNSASTKRIYAMSEYDPKAEGYFRPAMKAWWIGQMLTQGTSLMEKMVLFWHNHFASEALVVNSSKYMYMQNTLFRQNAFGNFRDLVKLVSIDPAMLVYLNGDANVKGKPNENYARELQELFSIGKGPLIAPGDYTNYTEQDVREAARVLTGWRENRKTYTTSFNATLHDTGDKVFSSAYQNAVIKGKTGADGAKELDELVSMIFFQTPTPKYICRKLYRWFVYYDITPEVEQNVIVPMANLLRFSSYNTRPVLEALLRSAHFFADDSIGCGIKTPLDFLVGTIRHCEIPVPDPAQDQLLALNARYSLALASAALQMDIFDPPGVAGWQPYYQEPAFSELWINTATLPTRGGMTDAFVDGKKISNSKFQLDVIALAQSLTDPSIPQNLITELAQRLFALDITPKQRDYLLQNVLLPGLPDYEWTVEWSDYIQHPTDAQKKKAVQTKLNELIKFLFRLAEYQLC